MPSADSSGFGGQGTRSIDLSPNHYTRFTPPKNDGAFGGDDDDDALNERRGHGVFSAVRVERAGNASRVGIRVEGGARYNVSRRGRDLVVTLFDTRAQNLDVRRILDARSLDTNVLRVLPSVDEGSRYRIELVIEVQQPQPVRATQEDGMLWLTIGDAGTR